MIYGVTHLVVRDELISGKAKKNDGAKIKAVSAMATDKSPTPSATEALKAGETAKGPK